MIYKINTDDINDKVLRESMEDPVAWLQSLLDSEVAKRRRNLVQRKTAEDIANPDVTSITANEDTILNGIFDADGYETVAEKAAKTSSQ